MQKNKIRWKDGSFTIEASMVMPFLCFLLAVLVQLVLYLHDVSMFVSAAYEAAQKGAELEDYSREAKEAYAQKLAVMLLENQRLAFPEYEAEALEEDGKMQIIIRGNSEWFEYSFIEVQKEATCVNGVTYLRTMKKMTTAWDKLN